MFSAAHALKDLEEHTVLIPVRNGEFVPIIGSGRGNSKVDAGVFRIENEDLSPFLDIALPGGVVFMQSEIMTDNLSLYGYPARIFRTNGSKIEFPAHHYSLRGKQDADYKRLGYDPQDHILLRWPKGVVAPHGRERSPSLAGMSGSGVWFAPIISERSIAEHVQHPMPLLVGIFIEQKRQHSALVATNICHHVRLACDAFPDLGRKFRKVAEARMANWSDRGAPRSILEPWKK